MSFGSFKLSLCNNEKYVSYTISTKPSCSDHNPQMDREIFFWCTFHNNRWTYPNFSSNRVAEEKRSQMSSILRPSILSEPQNFQQKVSTEYDGPWFYTRCKQRTVLNQFCPAFWIGNYGSYSRCSRSPYSKAPNIFTSTFVVRSVFETSGQNFIQCKQTYLPKS